MTEAEELELLELEEQEAQAMAAPKKAERPEGPDGLRSGILGYAQGGTGGFADEIGGGLASLFMKGSDVKLGAGAKLAADDTPEVRAAKMEATVDEQSRPGKYTLVRDAMRRENELAQKNHGAEYLTGNIAGGLSTAPLLPGAGAKTFAQMLKAGAGVGAAAGLGSSNADLLEGEVGGALADTALGGVLGAGAGALGYGVGKLGSKIASYAKGKIKKVEDGVQVASKEEAAAATASAKSTAGTSAQDAYKQLEHLRELNRVGKLTPEEKLVFDQLSEELGQKAQEKLIPAATRKAAKKAEYDEAIASEAQRAEKIAAEKLSGGEFGRQVMARVKRYGLPAAGGAVLGGLGLGPAGALGGAALGGALGNNFRPMMHSLLRLGKSPVVQRSLFKTLQKSGQAFEPTVERAVWPTTRALQPDLVESIIPAFADEDEERLKSRMLAEALRRR